VRPSTYTCEPLEARRLFAGVTLITHGFEVNQSEDIAWASAMAQAVAAQAGAGTPIFNLVVDGLGNATLQRVSGQPVDSNPNGDIVIVLNWSALSDNLTHANTNTAYIADRIAPAFTQTFSDLGIDHPLAELPIHLIGHSRGGSLVSALAKDLGADGIWVDQMTTLDPHPVQSSLLINTPDPDTTVWDNVRFADNYYETNAIIDGASVSGAHNIDLSGVFPSGILHPIQPHEDVHTFYHGTIDTSATDDSSAPIDPTWYSYQGTGPRSSVGFALSLLGGQARPDDGSLQAGAARVHVPLSVSGTDQWDNVDLTDHRDSQEVREGDPLSIKALFQDDNRDSTVTVGLDTDANPYNGFGNVIDPQTVQLSQGAVTYGNFTAEFDSKNILAGTYRVFTEISNGTHTRYFYSPGTLTVDDNIVSFGGRMKAVYTDPSGATVTASLSGPGSGEVDFFTDGTAPRLYLFSTTGGSNLSITTRGGAASFDMLYVTSSIGTISAPSATVFSDLTIQGSAKQITLSSASGSLTVQGTAPLNISLGQALNLDIASNAVIRTLTVINWRHSADSSNSVTAPAIGTLQTRGAFSADLSLSSRGLALSTLNVGGPITGCTIATHGSIGSVIASSIVGATIVAGVSQYSDFPTTQSEFGNRGASVKSLTVGRGVFSNTYIAAPRIGTLSLGRVVTANGGNEFGVNSHTIQALALSTPQSGAVRRKNFNSTKSDFDQGDFAVSWI
jgi:hypothetical protein